ncbi:MAG: MerR family transcriptional regulator [Bacteroidales bacterium]|nr:MerR family transcriptional regulator [Bacteroidales bacterium]
MHKIFYKIGEVAELLGIEQYTLRYLEHSLRLKIQRDERGDRLYSESDLDTFKLILKLKNEKGLNTTAIKLALENMESSPESELPATPSPNNVNISEMVSVAKRIVEQNDELLMQNARLEKRIQDLENKIDKKEQERQSKIDEFISLWRAEQERNKSWLSKLRGK